MLRKMYIVLRYWLLLFGLILVLIGFGADFIVDGNPGFSAMQIAAVVSGGLLLIVSWSLGRDAVRQQIRKTVLDQPLQKLTVIALSVVFSLIVAEFTMALTGFQPDFTGSYEGDAAMFTPDPLFMCDDVLGCRFNYEMMQAACAAGYSMNRECYINEQGYYDNDPFVVEADLPEDSFRVLLLGDSFTWGWSADIGQSWTEYLDSHVGRRGDVVFWNTGIAGIGTNQQYAMLTHYGPMLRPDVVVMGYFPDNDFGDSVYSLNSVVRVEDKLWIVRTQEFNENMELVERPPHQVAYSALDVRPPDNAVDYRLRTTRVGSAISNGLLERVRYLLSRRDNSLKTPAIYETEEFWQFQVENMENLIGRIREYTDQQGYELLVLLIPARDSDFHGSTSPNYSEAERILQGYDIPYLNIRDALVPEIDYMLTKDRHWNNRGHQIVGAIVNDCLQAIYDGAAVDQCHERIVTAE